MTPKATNVQSLLGQALEIEDAAGRAAYLDQACQGDAGLRAEVESLLAAWGRAGAFLQAPVGAAQTAAYQPVAEGPGTRIGPYKLLQKLGEGGMGVVFMAEQQQPVRRKVAVKIIKPGMDSQQVVARFEAERQALALMDHPNIARVLDGGTTDSGRPFFVMELVHGVPITKYCDDNKLTPRERLELFVPVCQAIQHAHQKGIIHRDIKPSNVLVTLYDDRPVPKVIDFGVAKAIEQRLTEKTLFTQYGALVGTFEYMSPEQAEMNALGVDTRSDVYSLGVLLYELLTGTTPLERQRLREAAFDELRRIIREEEPPRPSQRLSSLGATLTSVSSARRTEPGKLTRLLRGEVDWIVMRCLEKDRTRRYDGAGSLAREVQRYLADEPVEAGPPSAGYRMRKLARKHRGALTLAGTVAVLLLLGAGLSAWQAWRATRAEERATEGWSMALDAQQDVVRAMAAEKASRETLRRSHYILAMNQVRAAWEAPDLFRAEKLLDDLRPKGDEEDLRGFEWRFWDRQLHQERRRVVIVSGPNSNAFLSGDGRRACCAVRGDQMERVLMVVATDGGHVVFTRKRGAVANLIRLRLSHDGSRLACILQLSTATGGAEVREVVVWDVDSGEQVFDRKGSFADVHLSNDGKRLVTLERPDGQGNSLIFSDRGALLRGWDLAAPEKGPTFTHKGQVPTFFGAIAPDGSRLVDRRLQVVDLATGQIRQKKVEKEGWGFHRPVFCPDGSTLFSLEGEPSNRVFGTKVRMWKCLADGRLANERVVSVPPRVMSGLQAGGMVDVRLTPSVDGRWLALWQTGGSVLQVLDAATGDLVQVWKTPQLLRGVTFHKDARLSTLGFQRRERALVWMEWAFNVPIPRPAAGTGKQEAANDRGRLFRWRFSPEIRWSRDGQRQAVARAGKVILRDRNGNDIRELCDFAGYSAEDIRFSPNGRFVYAYCNPLTPGQDSLVRLRIWDAVSGQVRKSVDLPSGRAPFLLLRPYDRWAPSFSQGLGERLLPWPDPSGAVQIVDLDEVRELFSVGKVEKVVFSPDERRLVAMGGRVTPDGRRWHVTAAVLWDVDARRAIGKLTSTQPWRLSDRGDFSPNGRFFILRVQDGNITFWESGGGEKRFTLSAGRSPEMVHSPDGTRLLTVEMGGWGDAGQRVALWDLASGKELYRLDGLPSAVNHVVFSPDGKRFATFHARRLEVGVKLWETATGQGLLTLPVEAALPNPETTMVVFSDDGHRLMLQDETRKTILTFDATPRREKPSEDVQPLPSRTK